MAITSDEVNYLVWRYLQESGFVHSAFTFSSESLLSKANLNTADVAPGALISYLQKGLLYKEIEAHLEETPSDPGRCTAPFTLLQNHVCKRDKRSIARSQSVPAAGGGGGSSTADDDGGTLEDKMDEDDRPTAPPPRKPKGSGGMKKEKGSNHSSTGAGGGGGGGAHSAAGAVNSSNSDLLKDDESALKSIPDSNVVVLKGHDSEVFICSWSPTAPLLASGAGDSTARIWSVSRENTSGGGASVPCTVLKHISSGLPSGASSAGGEPASKDVTTLDWHPEGTHVATGSYDGHARVWNAQGELQLTLSRHKGPIFALRYNKRGDLLLSGSVDRSAIVWDARTAEVRQQFELHKAPTLDVDWRSNTSFASCSTDKLIYVCELGKTKPLKQYAGHTDEVNAVRWDPSGTLLASCSDDCTAKLWSLRQPDQKHVHDLREHSKEIYTIKWSPTGQGSENPNRPLVLATASFDASIKLWDAETGNCVHTLQKHTDPVYSVAFSPSGEYLASGSFDSCLYIWSVRDGRVLRQYRGRDFGGIFEVCWNRDGDRVAACFANSVVCVLDVRM